MGTLDPVLVDVATQVGISTSKAAALLSSLLSTMTMAPGLATFVDRFRQAGYGEIMASWLGGSLRPISSSELETVLGREWIDTAATTAGLSFPAATEALSFLLPQLIQRLTPGGVVPSRIPSDVLAYVQPAKPQAVAKPLGQGKHSASRKAATTAAPHWLWPALVVLTFVLLGCWFWIVRHSRQNGRIRRKYPLTTAHGTGHCSPLATHSQALAAAGELLGESLLCAAATPELLAQLRQRVDRIEILIAPRERFRIVGFDPRPIVLGPIGNA